MMQQNAMMERAFLEANPQVAMEQAFAEPAPGDLWAEEFANQQEELEDLAHAAEMVAALRGSGNPKLANSQFVSFIDKVSKQQMKFEGNTVVDAAGREVDWETLYDVDAAEAQKAGVDFEEMWKASDPLEDAWLEEGEGWG